jgi:hypothetical protein
MTHCNVTNRIKFSTIYIVLVFSVSCREKANDTTRTENTLPAIKTETRIDHSGTYLLGQNIEEGSVGTVLIYSVNDSVYFFNLDLNRGAPSYNMGWLSGEIIIKNNIGIFKSEDVDYPCALNFEFHPDSLLITYEKGQDDCGFGHGVFADYTYLRKSKDKPEFYQTGEGDTVYFKNLIRGE